MKQETYNELYSYMESKRVISTHSHHREDEFHARLNLDEILRNSYVNWCGAAFGEAGESKKAYLDKVRYNSYFIWLEKAFQKIYSFNEPISVQNWECISDMVKRVHADSGHHLDILKDHCKYENIVLDTYWNPGSDNNHPELFAPTFRINMFLYGFHKSFRDHNGNNPLELYGIKVDNIDDYISSIKKIITAKKAGGCVALKSALAYDRGLDFREVSKEKAQKVMKASADTITQEDAKTFGDYVFFELCKIAAELNLPMQCHTGLGQMKKTNALQMQEVIEKNPDTRFVLFHGGYPWLDDMCGLTHVYKNVYPDICWLPLISTSAAERLMEELIEVSTADRICWGCDTWTSEESFGALLAVRHVLAKVLSKKVCEGYIPIDFAKKIIDNVLYDNAKALYGDGSAK